MPARTGAEYVARLKDHPPTVYWNGRRVEDVTAEPIFQGPLQAIAEQYDMQFDPAYRDVMLHASPTTGDPVSTSFMIPYSREELSKKRKHFKLRADQNFGFLGRAPDFMNATYVTSWYLAADSFATLDPRFGENGRRYFEFAREHDLFLTHTLINPQVDRGKSSATQEDPHIHLSRVGETSEGIIVRGAKMLATMAPIVDETLVVPYGGIAPGEDVYAVSFSIANDAPGLKYICRETVAPLPRTRFDHPLSSRFEEMDCVAIFDDVLVPWDRVVVDGRPGSADLVNSGFFNAAGSTGILQIMARTLSQLEFFCGLAMKLADAIGITGFLHIQDKLGEMLQHLEIARSLYYGAEGMAYLLANGMWVPGGATGLRAFHMQTATHIYQRFVEIVQVLAGGGFFYAPTRADLDNPEIRPYIDTYVRGRPGVSAEERIALFKLAWDATGEAFGQRMNQYVRFYSGDPIRNSAGLYLSYNKAPLFEVVERALGQRDGETIPVSADNPFAPREGQTPVRPAAGKMAGAYPLSSVPAGPKAAAAAGG